jgi:hypothetical protein
MELQNPLTGGLGGFTETMLPYADEFFLKILQLLDLSIQMLVAKSQQ